MEVGGHLYSQADQDREREIITTTLYYHDCKTTIPRRIAELLCIKPDKDRIVWIREGSRIYVEAAKRKR